MSQLYHSTVTGHSNSFPAILVNINGLQTQKTQLSFDRAMYLLGATLIDLDSFLNILITLITPMYTDHIRG